MASNTIREFLVSLGFSVDESSFRKFNDNVLKATEPVLKLGAAVAATATAVEVMVERVARQMEDLYYAAQRTNATADSLQAVAFAAKQVGLDAGEGTDLIEGLARSMRESPGVEGLINGLGVQTREANGHLRDTTKITDELLEKLKQMPRYQALAYGQTLGLNPDALNQVLNNLPGFLKAQDDAAASAHQFGLDLKQVSADSAEFDRHLNALELSFQNLATRIGHDWMPAAQGTIDFVNRLVIGFGEWNDAIGGTPGKIGAITAAFGALAAALAVLAKLPPWLGGGLFAWLAGLAGATGVGAAAATAAAAQGAVAYAGAKEIEKESGGEIAYVDPVTGVPVYGSPIATAPPASVEGAAPGSVPVATAPIPPPASAGSVPIATVPISPAVSARGVPVATAPSSGQPLGIHSNNPGTPVPLAPGARLQGASPAPDLPLGIRVNNPGNIQHGGVEDIYASPLAGLSAMAGNLLAYAAKGYDTIASVVARWSPAGAGNDAQAYVGDVTKQTGFGAGQHLDLRNPAVLERLMAAMVQHENGQNPYAPDLYAAAVLGRIGTGAPSVTLNQQTEININGTGDPQSVGGVVAGEQARVNGDIVRNLGSVVR